tara:strand:- start:521 stop:916 length:396 start_codon:yes stop_codon:yes gene_type:complete
MKILQKISKNLLILLVFLGSYSVFANDFLCFETNDKTGEMEIVNELLFKKKSNNKYELSFPDYPENGVQIFDVIHQVNQNIILNLSGVLELTAYSFNIIINKDDLTFGTASLITPFMLDNMELSYGFCNQL